MKPAFASAFAYSTDSALMLIGRLHKGPDVTGATLLEVSQKLNLKVKVTPKRQIINFKSEIDVTKLYCGYYNKEEIEAVFSQKNVNVLDRNPNLFVDTFVIIADHSQSVVPLDMRQSEIAVIIAGKSAKMIYNKLELSSKVRRVLDIPSAATFTRRRLCKLGLEPKASASADVASPQPRREPANQQMYASEPGRMPGKDFPM